ncbi:DUF3800 domain-containing protein [Pseudomonas sp. 10B1]|uniref:DUF3800 domain-containing protein n=1 Tax=Pseudomonas sp. 10B1 TaxID=3048573 RepID=UPI002B23A7F2|nr:DUF3800 domain-containing protein [Pseudomonas sp. 10B1]MEB0311545.1 DUF3800 domain-containing protein [Pseudomonas sp. 10B1]
MTKLFIYLDESGDLGWKLDQPYRDGGSSRFLTIAALIVSENSVHAPARVMRKLYDKFKWPTNREKKWARMEPEERIEFARLAAKLSAANAGGIQYVSITARKCNVRDHIRRDPNKLYNYMIGLLLLDHMARADEVIFAPDDRSIKVRSGNSLNDYLQTKLWFDKQATTVLKTVPCDSATNLCVQFADMISGVAQSHYEDRNSESLRTMARCFRPFLIYN